MRLTARQQEARRTLRNNDSVAQTVTRRAPELRLPDGDVNRAMPFKLLGLVEGYAIIRRPGCLVGVRPLKVWDAWTLVDKDGRALEGESS